MRYIFCCVLLLTTQLAYGQSSKSPGSFFESDSATSMFEQNKVEVSKPGGPGGETNTYRRDVDAIRREYQKKLGVDTSHEAVPENSTPIVVELFVSNQCEDCAAFEAELRKEDLDVELYNIDTTELARRMFKLIDGTAVPTTRVGQRVVRGYNLRGVLSAVDAERGSN